MILLTFHVQLPTCIIHEQKLHFIPYKSASLFSVRTVFTQSFEHLNKVSARATMNSKEHSSVIKFLLLKGEKPCYIFQRLQKSFSKACLACSTFYSLVSQIREGRTSVKDKPRPGRPGEAVTTTMVANVEVFANKDHRMTLQ